MFRRLNRPDQANSRPVSAFPLARGEAYGMLVIFFGEKYAFIMIE